MLILFVVFLIELRIALENLVGNMENQRLKVALTVSEAAFNEMSANPQVLTAEV